MKLATLSLIIATAILLGLEIRSPGQSTSQTIEALTGFDDQSNGFSDPDRRRADEKFFEEVEHITPDGLGPLYSAQSCRECHQNPVSGATSQVTELRAGTTDGFGNFTNPPGGSLINDRAINAAIQERLTTASNTVDTRSSLNILGDGFVEAIADATFTNIRNAQPSGMKGQIINVPVSEAPGQTRIGRFGWKNQNSSLLSFAADA